MLCMKAQYLELQQNLTKLTAQRAQKAVVTSGTPRAARICERQISQDAGPPLLLYVDEIRQLEDEAACVVRLEQQLL